MQRILCLLLIFLSTSPFLLAQSFDWSRSFGASGTDYSKEMALDDKGHVYSSGGFNGTVDFDPGAGVSNLTGQGLKDCFILHLDEHGDFVWVKQLISNDFVEVLGIDIDAAGNVYCAGNFRGTTDFDPGPGTFNLTADSINNYGTFFVLKLDPAGDFIWAKSMGGNYSAFAGDLVLDHQENILITGFFRDTVDIDLGPGTFMLEGNIRDIFVLKLTSAGNFIWAIANVEANGNYSGDGTGWSLGVDQYDNVYLTGDVGGEIDFDPGPGQMVLVTNSLLDSFVQKLDQNGNLQWAVLLNCSDFCRQQSLVVDPNGSVYTAGIFSGTLDADPSAANFNLVSNGGWDVYIQKLDASGNLAWAYSYGSPNDEYGRSLTMDGNGDVYLVGDFDGIVDFDPGVGTDILTNAGRDIFLQKFDSSGNHVWVLQFGGSGSETGWKVKYSPDGIYLQGNFQSVVDLDPYAGVSTHVSGGGNDFYLLRLNGLLVSNEIGDQNARQIQVSPNPTAGLIDVLPSEGLDVLALELRDLQGRLLLETVLPQGGTTLDLSKLPSGYYYVQCQLPSGTETVKILKY